MTDSEITAQKLEHYQAELFLSLLTRATATS